MSVRTVRVTDENFDHEGFEKTFKGHVTNYVGSTYMKPAAHIDLAQKDQKSYAVDPISQQDIANKQSAIDRLWSPSWAQLSLIGLVAPLNTMVKKNDAKNFIHPFFRRVALPVAAATIALSAKNAYDFTLTANYDERTARYQAAANVTWQLTNNVILPTILMKTFGIPLPTKQPPQQAVPRQLIQLESLGLKPPSALKTSTARTYGGAALAAAIAVGIGQYTKFATEGWFVRRRFERKDYGSHGHSYETTDFKHDNIIDQFEQSQNEQGDEYIINPINERAYAEIFPFFSLAEAVATHEVPYNSSYYQNQTPIAFQSALLQGTLDLSQPKGAVPVPSVDTFQFARDTFGEWSIATPYQIAADKQLLAQPQGRAALVQVFSDMTPLLTKPKENKE